MTTMTLKGAKGEGDFFRLHFWGAVLLVLGALLALGAFPAHAAPLAGTAIGNQASASYKDNNNIDRITVSNAVATVVSQVYSATLDQTQNKIGAPGQTLAFPHTITNSGNGPDTFTLSIAGVTGSAFVTTPTSGNAFFADNNCDGVADNNTNVTSVGPVAPGSQACFVAQASLGTSVSTSSFAVQAVGSNSVAASNSPNTDTVSVTTNAVISLTKAINISAGPTGTRVTYTLTYRNTGNVSAGSVVIADTIPSGATYVNNSATWSALTTTLTDANNDAAQGSSPYRIAFATSGGTIVAVLERVDPGVQGTLSFMVDITGSGPIISNSGFFCYRDQGTLGTIQPTAANSSAGVNGGCSGVMGTANLFTGNANFNFTNVTAIIAAGTNPQQTNIVPFTVVASNNGASIFNDGRAGGSGGDGVAGSGLPTDGTLSNTALVNSGGTTSGTTVVADFDVVPATAGQGTLATWDTYVWNTGGSTDTYNISVMDNNFPSGTTFLLFRADRATPLTDSNGDGVIDTGPVPGYGSSCNATSTGSPNATGASSTPCGFRVHVVAQLPPSGVGGPYDVVLRSASGNTPSAVNQVVARLQAVTRSKVDLYNVGETGGAQGNYGGPNPGVSNTVTATPGGAATFGLVVNNPGTVADSYDLAYTVASSGTAVTGAFSGTAPYAFTTACLFGNNCGATGDFRGFTLTFYADGGSNNCSTLGPTLTNTGVIQPSQSKIVCAIVSVPTVTTAVAAGNTAGITAGNQAKIFFRALSPTTYDGTAPTASTTAAGTGSVDIKRDDLLIGTSRAVTITPNNSGQAIAGGSIQYCHAVTNAGNVSETLSTNQTAQSLFTSGAGWPQYATFYLDTNNNCVLDGTEGTAPLGNPTASLGSAFTPGLVRNLIVVVQVPGAAAAGQSNVTTVQVTGGPATVSAIDTTVVVVGQVQLVKEQATDVNCDGTADGSQATFTQAQIPASSSTAPGNCILYRVTATNIGTQAVSNVIVTDSTPANTKQGANTCNVGAGTALRATTTGTGTPTPSGPGPDTSGSIATGAVSLNPGQNVILTFCVRIDP